MSELHFTVVTLVIIKCRLQTMQTVQTKQVVQLLCLLFLNCDLHLSKVCTPFPYSFGNILTPHSKILRGSFEVTLSGKTKSRGQVFRARAD